MRIARWVGKYLVTYLVQYINTTYDSNGQKIIAKIMRLWIVHKWKMIETKTATMTTKCIVYQLLPNMCICWIESGTDRMLCVCVCALWTWCLLDYKCACLSVCVCGYNNREQCTQHSADDWHSTVNSTVEYSWREGMSVCTKRWIECIQMLAISSWIQFIVILSSENII